ncbi:MAG: hypothetical protein WD065_11050, partial [Planctomycetaceae bacterium]
MNQPPNENYDGPIEPAPAPGIPDVPEQKFGPEPHDTVATEIASAIAVPREIPHGESQWGIIWRQFRKRKLAVFSAAAIWILISVSIWAPFIANDRPLMYVGYNRQEFKESARTARIMLNQFIDQKWKTSDESWIDWRRTQVEIFSLQLDLMGAQLAELEYEQLEKFREQFYAAVGVDDPDEIEAATLRQLRTDLRQKFDGQKVSYQYRQFWPVLRSLSAVEIFFLAGNISVILWPVWAKMFNLVLFKGERRPTPPAIRAVMLAGLPLLAGIIWYFWVPQRLDRTNYKDAVLANEADQAMQALVVFEGVVWPPIHYGLDEDHLRRKFARPYFMGKKEESSDEAS